MLILSIKLHGEETVWQQIGIINEKLDGWAYIQSKDKGKMVYYTDEGFYQDRGGKLEGSKIPLMQGEFRFYRYTFDSLSSAKCYWAMDFYDKEGKRIKGDCYSSIFPSRKRVHNTGVFYGRIGTCTVKPFFLSHDPYTIWNLKIETLSPGEAAEWCDELYATLPSLEYTPVEGRLRHIPKTMAALETGKLWRMHILGHSLYNDAYNSNFQALLKRAYPSSNLQVTYGGRGSTGCEHYQNHMQEYVFSYKPDVVIVCGLGEHIDQIASVVTQIKAWNPDCEIILMSEPINRDIRSHDSDNRESPLKRQELDVDKWFIENIFPKHIAKDNSHIAPMVFVEIQKKFASDQRIAFLDAKGAWYEYLGHSGKPWEWFHRDAVHANDRGKQIIARIIERYFAYDKVH